MRDFIKEIDLECGYMVMKEKLMNKFYEMINEYERKAIEA